MATKTFKAKELRCIYKDVKYNWSKNSDHMVIFENDNHHKIEIYKSEGEVMLGVYDNDELKSSFRVKSYEDFTIRFSKVVGGIVDNKKELVNV